MFSDVYPIGIKHSDAAVFSETFFDNLDRSTQSLILYIDILSTPAPMPISITPDIILAAIMEQDYSPDEQSLLIATMEVVSGNPAKNIAILFGIYPAPG